MTTTRRTGDRRGAPHRPRDRAGAARGRIRGRDPRAAFASRRPRRCATRSCAQAGAPRSCARTSPITRRSRDLSRRRVDAVGPLTLAGQQCASFEPDEIGALDVARFDRQIAVNLRAPLFLSEAFAAQAPAGSPTPRSSTFSISACSSSRRTSSPTRWRKARCMRRRACWRRRSRRRCASTRWRRGRRWQSARQSAEDFARQAAAVPLGRGPSAGGDCGGRRLSRRCAQRDRRDARGRRRPASRVADARRERGRMSDVRSSEDVDFDSEVPVLIIGAGAAGLMRGAGRERSRRRAGGDRARRGAVRIDRTRRQGSFRRRARASSAAGRRGLRRSCSPPISRARRTARPTRKLVRAVAEDAGPTVEWLADDTRCRSRSSPTSTIRAIRRIACTACRAAPAPS